MSAEEEEEEVVVVVMVVVMEVVVEEEEVLVHASVEVAEAAEAVNRSRLSTDC